MNVANARVDRLYFALKQLPGRTVLQQRAVMFAMAEAFHRLGTAQHPYKTPDAVIVDRSRLPWPPDEGDHTEALKAVAVQKILLVTVRVRRGVGIRQPAITFDKPRQQGATAIKDRVKVVGPVEQHCKVADETPQRRKIA